MYELLKFIRFKNIIMCVLQQFLIYYLLNKSNDYKKIYLLNLSHSFMGIFIYVMNDLFDLNTDRLNKPDRYLVKNKRAYFYSLIAMIPTCYLGIFLGFKVNYNIGLINLYGATIPFIYDISQRSKKLFLLKNFIVSTTLILITISPLILLNIFNNKYLLLSLLSFLTTYQREIIKDMEDIDGDRLTGKYTIPIVYGINKSKKIIYFIIFLINIIFSYLNFSSNLKIRYFNLFIYYTYYVIVDILKNARDKYDYTLLSKLSKYQMLLGILTLPFIVY